MRKRLNAAERRGRKAAALQLYVKQVGRRAQKGTEPNDRLSKRETTDAVRRIPTGELDRLLRHGEE